MKLSPRETIKVASSMAEADSSGITRKSMKGVLRETYPGQRHVQLGRQPQLHWEVAGEQGARVLCNHLGRRPQYDGYVNEKKWGNGGLA